MNYRISIIALASALCLFPLTVSAQTLNQTVKIENTYESSATKAARVSIPLSIPDSLKSFDYKFGYEVFDTPYKGAFEFKPYTVSMTPAAEEPLGSKHFYLRAGAGYQFRPELFASFAPDLGDKFSVNIRQSLRGYCGQYRTVRTDLTNVSPLMTTIGSRYDGYDLRENLGADLKWNIGDNAARLSVDYNGLFNEDQSHSSAFNSIGVKAGFGARERITSRFFYDFTLRAKLSQDKLGLKAIFEPLVEREFGLSGTVTPKIKDFFDLVVDFDLAYYDYSANGTAYDNSFFAGFVKPSAEFNFGDLTLCGGLNLCVSPVFCFTPDLRLNYKIKDFARAYLSYTGGVRVNSYSSLKGSNVWFYPAWGDKLRATTEKLNLTAGFAGRIGVHFQYDLSGGFLVVDNDPVWGVSLSSSNPTNLGTALVYESWKGWKADLKMAWKSNRIDADATVRLRGTNMTRDATTIAAYSEPTYSNSSVAAIDFPLASGNARIVYNWKHKIYGGVRVAFSTSRNVADFVGSVATTTGDLMIQPYIDLGVYGEYRFSDKFSVYLQGVNLLGESIQTLPLHVENGFGVTAGITLAL